MDHHDENDKIEWLFFIKQIVWLNKITILILAIFVPFYILTKEQQVLDILTIIGIAYLLYGGLLSQGYSSQGYSISKGNLPPSYIKSEYDKSVTWAARLRYLDSSVAMIAKGLLILLICSIFTFFY